MDTPIIFPDRESAAVSLAARLWQYKDHTRLVLAIPVLVHKISPPANPEYAIGQYYRRFEQIGDDCGR